MFFITRFLNLPLRKLIYILQNLFITYFEPMSIGPVSSQKWKKLINTLIKKDGQIIDFGCGTGSFSILFDQKKYIGFDINKKFIEIAKKRYPKYTFINNLEKNERDLHPKNILFNGVLHHIEDQNFKEIVEHLKMNVHKNCEIIFIEPVIPKKIFSIEFLIKSLDLGDYIRQYSQYIDLISSSLNVVEHFEEKIGWNNIIIIKAKFI